MPSFFLLIWDQLMECYHPTPALLSSVLSLSIILLVQGDSTPWEKCLRCRGVAWKKWQDFFYCVYLMINYKNGLICIKNRFDEHTCYLFDRIKADYFTIKYSIFACGADRRRRREKLRILTIFMHFLGHFWYLWGPQLHFLYWALCTPFFKIGFSFKIGFLCIMMLFQ